MHPERDSSHLWKLASLGILAIGALISFSAWGEEEEAEDPRIYEEEDCVPSCDKGGHKERSKYHQPNHNNHWKKVEEEED